MKPQKVTSFQTFKISFSFEILYRLLKNTKQSNWITNFFTWNQFNFFKKKRIVKLEKKKMIQISILISIETNI